MKDGGREGGEPGNGSKGRIHEQMGPPSHCVLAVNAMKVGVSRGVATKFLRSPQLPSTSGSAFGI